MVVGASDIRKILATYALCYLCANPIYCSQPRPRPQSQGRRSTTQPQERNSTLTRGEMLTPNPKSAIPRQRVEPAGAQPPPTPYIPGEGANHPTPRAQFHANERNKRRDANPQPNSTLTSGTNSPKRMRKSRGPSIYSCTRPITITPPAPHMITPTPRIEMIEGSCPIYPTSLLRFPKTRLPISMDPAMDAIHNRNRPFIHY